MRPKRLAILLLFFFLAMQVFPITIKIGRVAPENSPWGTALKRIAKEWRDITGGKIELKIYHSSTTGNETAMDKLIRFGQLDGGVFSSYGLYLISKEVLSLSIPFLIQNDEELEYVMDSLRPVLDAKIEENGFKNIGWSKAGWIRFFSTEAVVRPDDMRKLPLASSPDDADMEKTLKTIGFTVRSTPLQELMTSLNTGRVKAFYSSPIATGGYQWFGIANHMTDLKIAPFLGAIIISERSWEKKIKKAYPNTDELLAAVDEVVRELEAETMELEQEAVDIMMENGLVVHSVPDDAVQEWVDLFGVATERLLTKNTFSPEMVRLIEGKLDEVRD